MGNSIKIQRGGANTLAKIFFAPFAVAAVTLCAVCFTAAIAETAKEIINPSADDDDDDDDD